MWISSALQRSRNDYLHLSLASYIFCADIALRSETHVTFLVVC